MPDIRDPARRSLLRKLAAGLSLAPLTAAAAEAAELPLISEQDPAAVALKYVEDAQRASGAQPGATCATCSLFEGANGAADGKCSLFPGKRVKAAGWCSAWTNM